MLDNYPIRIPIQENMGIEPKNVFLSLLVQKLCDLLCQIVKFSKNGHDFRQIQLKYRENNFENSFIRFPVHKTLW